MAMEKFDFFYYILVNLKMIVSKTTLLKWNNANKKRYMDLGYRFTQCGDEFEVDINDLSKSCTATITVRCDFCGKEYTKTYKEWRSRQDKDDIIDACSSYKCRSLKTQQTNIKKYGCNCVFKNEDIKQKIKKSMMDIYGVEYTIQCPASKQKYHNTMRKKYGVDWYSQTDEFGNKYWQTRLANGHYPTSKVERIMCDMLISLYGNNAHPSYIYDRICMDCMIDVNGCKIDIEYDCQYWHKNRKKQDANRDAFVYQEGFKIIRIKGNYETPTIEELQEAIYYLCTTDNKYCEIIKDIE